MKHKTADQPRKGGRFGKKENAPKQTLAYRASSEAAEAVKRLADQHFDGEVSTASYWLVCYALERLNRAIPGVVLPLIPGLNAPDDQQDSTGDITLDHSPVHINTSDDATATVQIGKANRNVSFKKNHAEPVPPSKRRK